MDNKIKPQALLSTLWMFILFNMLLRDLHEFPTDGYVEELMSLKLSDWTMLFYGVIVEIPISMVLLSRILPAKVNRWANIFAAIITLLGILSTLPQADLDDGFFALMNTVAIIGIVFTSRKLSVSGKEKQADMVLKQA
ncbi:MAG: DUF6326 family protein [Bacteroidota bacterium]